MCVGGGDRAGLPYSNKGLGDTPFHLIPNPHDSSASIWRLLGTEIDVGRSERRCTNVRGEGFPLARFGDDDDRFARNSLSGSEFVLCLHESERFQK